MLLGCDAMFNKRCRAYPFPGRHLASGPGGKMSLNILKCGYLGFALGVENENGNQDTVNSYGGAGFPICL